MRRDAERILNPKFDQFINAVALALLDCDDVYSDTALRSSLEKQIEMAEPGEFDWTGAGFYCDFLVPESAPRVPGAGDAFLGYVVGSVDLFNDSVGFMFIVKNGALDCIEGYVYGDALWDRLPTAWSLEEAITSP